MMKSVEVDENVENMKAKGCGEREGRKLLYIEARLHSSSSSSLSSYIFIILKGKWNEFFNISYVSPVQFLYCFIPYSIVLLENWKYWHEIVSFLCAMWFSAFLISAVFAISFLSHLRLHFFLHFVNAWHEETYVCMILLFCALEGYWKMQTAKMRYWRQYFIIWKEFSTPFHRLFCFCMLVVRSAGKCPWFWCRYLSRIFSLNWKHGEILDRVLYCKNLKNIIQHDTELELRQ